MDIAASSMIMSQSRVQESARISVMKMVIDSESRKIEDRKILEWALVAIKIATDAHLIMMKFSNPT